jgi:glycosyltransferase involved in cell wall biosynthesis
MLFTGAHRTTAHQGRKAVCASDLSIFQVMPREMYFGPSRATSIDLCVRDLVEHSRYRHSTTIFAETAPDAFGGFHIEALPKAGRATTFTRANLVARAIRHQMPDLVVVQQHLPTAAAIARRVPGAKVVLYTHSFQKSYSGGASLLRPLRRAARAGRYSRLAGIVHVSQSCKDAFAQGWPSLRLPSHVIHNGLDFTGWRPAGERAREVLVVGRCAPEKGILEAAQGLAAVLPRYPNWRTRFILSATEKYPDYAGQVARVLSELGRQAALETQRPFEEIKAANERAAIAIVPSHVGESFGRTALEAHGGGAALISSGSGALPEVSGDAALLLPEVTPTAIADAVETLIRGEAMRCDLAQRGARRVRDRFDIRFLAARFDDLCLALALGHAGAGGMDGDTGSAPLRAAE